MVQPNSQSKLLTTVLPFAAALLFAGCSKNPEASNRTHDGAKETATTAASHQVSDVIFLVNAFTARHIQLEKAGIPLTEKEAKDEFLEFLHKSAEIFKFSSDGSAQELKIRLLEALVSKGYLMLADIEVNRFNNSAYLGVAISKIISTSKVAVTNFELPGLIVENQWQPITVIEFLPWMAGRPRVAIPGNAGQVVGFTIGKYIAVSVEAIAQQVADTPGVTKEEVTRYTVANEVAHMVLKCSDKPARPIHRIGGAAVLLESGQQLNSKMAEEAYSDWCSLANTSKSNGGLALDLLRNSFFDKISGNYALSFQITRNCFTQFLETNGVTPAWQGNLPPSQIVFETFLKSLNPIQTFNFHQMLLGSFKAEVEKYIPFLLQ